MFALPSTYRSLPVIPFAPNADADRAHQWDWSGKTDSIPSGLTIGSVDATQGSETFPLQYVGLTRSEARTLEAFVDSQDGRKTGFWCPTFQQDFYAVRNGGVGSGLIDIREWGYSTLAFPLGAGFHHFAAYRTGAWGLSQWNGSFSAAGVDSSGFTLVRYAADGGSVAGDANVWGNAVNGHSDGLVLMRMPFVRFAADAVTTEWEHPHLAAITLHVTTIPGEAA